MAVTRLNHAVLYVRDVDRSVAFWTEAMGFRVVMGFPGAAFLQAPASTNDHDLGLFEVGAAAAPSNAGRRGGVGLYHLAWEVETLADLAELQVELTRRGALVGASDHAMTKSLYVEDPDGLEFEVAWIVPAALLDAETLERRTKGGVAAGPRRRDRPLRRADPGRSRRLEPRRRRRLRPAPASNV